MSLLGGVHVRIQDGTEVGLTEGLPSLSYDGVTIKGTDTTIFKPDLDPKTVTSPMNPDTDMDGLKDGWVDANSNGIIDVGEGEDLNCNGRLDRDIVFGNNIHESDPNESDSDDDGLMDGEEIRTRHTDPFNWDTDGDGISDGTECGVTLDKISPGCNLSAGHFIPDADPSKNTNPLTIDFDNDGLPDGWIDANKNGVFDPGEGEDRNGNGAVDGGETDPTSVDTDNDHLLDGKDIFTTNGPIQNWDLIFNIHQGQNYYYWGELSYTEHNLNPNGNPFIPQQGPTDPTTPDSDGDGLWDGNGDDTHKRELVTTNFLGVPNNLDPAKKTRPDLPIPASLPGQIYYTDPSAMDSDGDGLSDGMEIDGWDINIIHEKTKERVKTIPKAETSCNPWLSDTDMDGIDDFAEFQNSSDPRLWDTDGDLILDRDEGQGNHTQIEGTDPVIVGEIEVKFVFEYYNVLGIRVAKKMSVHVAVHVTDNSGLDYVEVSCEGSDPKRDTFDGIVKDWTTDMTFKADLIGAFWSGYDIKVKTADKNGNGVKGKTHLDSVAEAVVKAILSALESFVKAVKELASKAFDWIWKLIKDMFDTISKPFKDGINNFLIKIANIVYQIATSLGNPSSGRQDDEDLTIQSFIKLFVLFGSLFLIIYTILFTLVVIETIVTALTMPGVSIAIKELIWLFIKPILQMIFGIIAAALLPKTISEALSEGTYENPNKKIIDDILQFVGWGVGFTQFLYEIWDYYIKSNKKSGPLKKQKTFLEKFGLAITIIGFAMSWKTLGELMPWSPESKWWLNIIWDLIAFIFVLVGTIQFYYNLKKPEVKGQFLLAKLTFQAELFTTTFAFLGTLLDISTHWLSGKFNPPKSTPGGGGGGGAG